MVSVAFSPNMDWDLIDGVHLRDFLSSSRASIPPKLFSCGDWLSSK